MPHDSESASISPDSLRAIRLPLTSIIVGMFMVFLDNSAVNVTVPHFVTEFTPHTALCNGRSPHMRWLKLQLFRSLVGWRIALERKRIPRLHRYVFPYAITNAILNQVSGRLFDKFGARWLAVIDIGCLAFSASLFSQIQPRARLSDIIIPVMLLGASLGFCIMPLTSHVLKAAPQQMIGRITFPHECHATSYGVVIGIGLNHSADFE